MEELLSRHRKEQRDLQSQITQKKKSASKKTRKSVNDECVQLEAALRSRQASETALLNGNAGEAKNEPLEDQQDLLDALIDATDKNGERNPASGTAKSHASGEDDGEDSSPGAQTQRKPNRQKARLARRVAEQEAAAAHAAEEANNLPDLKRQERDRMLEEFKIRNLKEHEVAANGHCLYLAFSDQMKHLEQPLTILSGEDKNLPDFKQARHSTASYIEKHSEDFLPFVEESLDEYIRKIRDTAEWGGQLELLALAKTYGVNINVLQGEGRVERIESSSDPSKPEVWLAYYRHGFGLGEHYNSLRKMPNS